MTFGMKVAISIPDEVSAQADRMAKEMGTSRSGLYRRALTSYFERMAPRDRTTDALDAVVDKIGQDDTRFAQAAARQRLQKNDW
jgi:metal-responsive CopG/Arc/MetJ family transcriptional regulator